MIEGKLAHMQVVCDSEQANPTDTDASVTRLEQVQRIATEFFEETCVVQKLLTNLHEKIAAPAE